MVLKINFDYCNWRYNVTYKELLLGWLNLASNIIFIEANYLLNKVKVKKVREFLLWRRRNVTYLQPKNCWLWLSDTKNSPTINWSWLLCLSHPLKFCIYWSFPSVLAVAAGVVLIKVKAPDQSDWCIFHLNTFIINFLVFLINFLWKSYLQTKVFNF